MGKTCTRILRNFSRLGTEAASGASRVYLNKNDECEALGAESEKLENYATELKKYARGEVKEEPVAPECFDANFAVKASSGEDLFLGM